MNRSWWRTYRSVNERFAVAIARMAPPNATVWVHDYHLLLVPSCCVLADPTCASGSSCTSRSPTRSCSPCCRGGRRCSMGMLGADLIGFQVADDAANFISTAERLLEVHAEGQLVTRVGARTVEVDAFPISVDFARWDAARRRRRAAAAALRNELDVTPDLPRHRPSRLHEGHHAAAAGVRGAARRGPARRRPPAVRAGRRAQPLRRARVSGRAGRGGGDRRADQRDAIAVPTAAGPVRYIESSFDDTASPRGTEQPTRWW